MEYVRRLVFEVSGTADVRMRRQRRVVEAVGQAMATVSAACNGDASGSNATWSRRRALKRGSKKRCRSTAQANRKGESPRKVEEGGPLPVHEEKAGAL